MATLQTYQDTSRKEDVSEAMMMLDITTTQMYSGFTKNNAYNTLHEWQVAETAAAADNAAVEGADFSSDTSTQPTRAVNYTQIFTKQPQVSDTEESVNHYGMKSAMSYQVALKMKEMKNDIELAIVRGTGASGNATVARRLNGVMAWITTNATAFNSGTTLTENILNDFLQLTWNNGGEVDEIYVGAALKRRISTFTGGNTKFLQAEDKRLVSSIDVYESDFGVHKIFKHRHVQVAADTTGNLLLIDSKRWKVSHLSGRAPFTRDIAKVGDSTRKQLIAELTIECHQQKANAKLSGLLIG